MSVADLKTVIDLGGSAIVVWMLVYILTVVTPRVLKSISDMQDKYTVDVNTVRNEQEALRAAERKESREAIERLTASMDRATNALEKALDRVPRGQ